MAQHTSSYTNRCTTHRGAAGKTGLAAKVRSLLAVGAAFVFASVLWVAALPAAAAAPAITLQEVAEAPEVRVVIDGEAGAYTDVALRIHDRILLPFRELLEKLGVPNDDAHIIWNEAEQSVTVRTNDGGEVRLVIGDPVMQVDGESKTFDVAPYFYPVNNRTYVPVRAVSELLNKLVQWEEASTTAYIRDTANYEETLAFLNESQSAAAAAQTKIKATSVSTMDIDVSVEGADVPETGDVLTGGVADMQQTIEADLDKGVFRVTQQTSMAGEIIDTDIVIYNNKTYMKIGGISDEWTDITAQGGLDIDTMLDSVKTVEGQLGSESLERTAMGMKVTRQADGGYVLSGEPTNVADVNNILGGVVGDLSADGLVSMSMVFRRLYLSERLDSDMRAVSLEMSADFDAVVTERAENGNTVTVLTTIVMESSVIYEDVAEDYEVVVPPEILALG
jgi:hypothetical protein